MWIMPPAPSLPGVDARQPLPPVDGGEALARAATMERREDGRAKLIKASQELRRRAVNRQRGLDLVMGDELRQRLETVIAAASPEFEKELLGRLADIRKLLTGLNGDDFAMIFLMPQLQELAIDVKGMGGTFGYHLLTDLGKSLQDFLSQIDLPTASEFEIVAIHVDAIYMLLAQRIRGQGGDLERQLLINLGYAADKIAGDTHSA